MAAVLGNLFEKLTITTCKLNAIHGTISSLRTSVRGVRTHRPAWSRQHQQPLPAVQKIDPLPVSERQAAYKEITSRINSQVANNSHGRLFAVVQIHGLQFKITDEDIIVVEGHWPPDVGDRIKLEKVLLVGGSDFTLVGTPILPLDIVSIEATIVDKGLSQTVTHFRKRRRKQYMRINFDKLPQSIVRINAIRLTDKIGQVSQDENLD